EAAEPRPIVPPLLGPTTGDLLDAHPFTAGRGLHLVLALVGIAPEVADVGDVGDVGDLEPRGEQHPPQEIRGELTAHVAEMLGSVDRGTAGVHPDPSLLERFEGGDSTATGVVELQVRDAHAA